MMNRQVTYMCLALTMAIGGASDARSEASGSAEAESDLTGYWQREDGTVFQFSQEGINLISRHDKRSLAADENDIDFTATVHGNLVYGAHRGPFSRAVQKKCAIQIWVGMGLTLSDDGTSLEGFRGDRIFDPKDCSAKNSEPVKLVYKRLPDPDPMQ